VVTLDGDSDDEFAVIMLEVEGKKINIKEEVKKIRKENGEDTRITKSIINAVVRWRLERNDCQNRGYVLDGYPKNFDCADKVFVSTPLPPKLEKDEEGNDIEMDPEELKKKMQPTLQSNIYPESVIVLHTTDQFLKRRSKTLM
jgi:adenylate kinase family enzyme